MSRDDEELDNFIAALFWTFNAIEEIEGEPVIVGRGHVDQMPSHKDVIERLYGHRGIERVYGHR